MSDFKIAFCIPTYKHPDMIAEFLEQFMLGYIERGIDIYIYDSSSDNETELIVKNFQSQTEHLYYIRMPEEVHAGAKIYQILQKKGLKREYDFVWACGDGIRYPIKALDILLPQIFLKYDVIHINAMDSEGIGCREYENCNEYFRDCAWHTTLCGALILNSNTILKDVCWEKYEKNFLRDEFLSYPHVCFYFNRFLELPRFRAKHISGYYSYTSKMKKRSGWYKDTFKVLADGWIKIINSLPDCYTDKDEVIRKLGKYSVLEDESAFLQKRIDGVYNEKIYIQYEEQLPQICDVPIEQLKKIAFMTVGQAELEMKKWIEKRHQNGLAELSAFLKKYPKILIYGAGLNAKRYAKVFNAENIFYEGFCVSQKKAFENKLMGHQIYAVEELENDLKSYGIYLALNVENRKQVRSFLQKKGLSDQLFFSEELDKYVCVLSKDEDV